MAFEYRLISLEPLCSDYQWCVDSPNIADAGSWRPDNFLRIEGWACKLHASLVHAAIYSEVIFRGPLLITNLTSRPDVNKALGLDMDAKTGFRFDLNLAGLQNTGRIILCTVSNEQFSAFSLNAAFHMHNFSALCAINLEICCALIHPRVTGRMAQGRSVVAPLLVTSMGRSGSTALMSCLAKAPEVYVSGHYPYESCPLSYFVHVMRMVTSPSPEYMPISVGGFLDTPFMASTNPFIDQINYPSLYNIFQANNLDLMSEALIGWLEKLARAGAARQYGDGQLKYVAEKLPPNTMVGSLCRMVWEDTVEIVLTRELEDWLRSAVQFSAATNGYLGSQRDDDQLVTDIEMDVRAFMAYVQAHRSSLRIVNFSSLISGAAELADLLTSVGISATAAMRETMDHPPAAHTTRGSASVPRFHHLLQDSRIRKLVAEYNEAFGHAPTSQSAGNASAILTK